MRILTIGDSFTYGDELVDIQQAWPYVLQNKLSCELTNLGKPATGNTSMVRNVVEHARDYDLIIVAWSHFARIEFADEHGIFDTWPGHRGVAFTNNIAYRMELLNYINRHHNDEYLYKQYLLNIILLQTYADHLGKKLLMLNTQINWNKLSEDSYMEKFASTINRIDTQYFIGWPNESMMEWTFGTPKGPNGHFLAAGHTIVADKIYEYIRHLGWVS
jgi:hypothetical protein